MEYASSIKARLVLIVGPREIKENKVKLRDMKTGHEQDIEKKRIVDETKKILTMN